MPVKHNSGNIDAKFLNAHSRDFIPQSKVKVAANETAKVQSPA